jgi:hypothetical protein
VSQRPDVLKKFRADNLSVLASIGSDPKPFVNPVVISSWTRNTLGETAEILINNLEWDATVELVATSTQPGISVPCRRLPAPATAFDSSCQIPLTALRGRNQFILVRRRFETYAPNIKIPFLLP